MWLRASCAIWPALRGKVAAMLVPWQRLAGALEAAGGSSRARGYGIDGAVWSEAVLHARELRNRFTILDLADDAGLLRAFVADLERET